MATPATACDGESSLAWSINRRADMLGDLCLGHVRDRATRKQHENSQVNTNG